MGVVVDVDISCFFVILKAVEVDAFFVVLADVVAYDYVSVSLFHDAAEPHVVVTVVVLNEGVDAVVVCVESSSVASIIAYVAVCFVVLDFDAVGVKAEDAVSGVVSAGVG